jgi:hypothetical protein
LELDHLYANDLWSYNPTTGMVTWISGSYLSTGNIETLTKGVYGTKGTPSTSNTPGGRYGHFACTSNDRKKAYIGFGSGYYSSGGCKL